MAGTPSNGLLMSGGRRSLLESFHDPVWKGVREGGISPGHEKKCMGLHLNSPIHLVPIVPVCMVHSYIPIMTFKFCDILTSVIRPSC